ncbi:universal stress protein [Pedobacter sp. P351]|uniref:universal stress protein n=1 Tax=Pedobacter superstes TaxID=3133441 RepID=UPI0030B7C9DB
MKTILLLTDFSVRAQYAAEYAMRIAVQVKANLLLCHSMEIIENDPMAEQMTWPIANHLALQQESLAGLKEIARQLEQNILADKIETDFKPVITCINDFGKLSVVTANIIEEKKVDLIIMGSHKSNGLARFLFGSHTHDILDNINCPVLLVPESLKFKGIRSIAYATDLTFSDLKVINFLSKIAIPCNARILVSHISPFGISETDSENTKHSIQDLLSQEEPKIVYASIKGVNIPKRLIEISGSGKADLLALVHKQYGFFEGLFHSSVSKQMANSSKIPLLILPHVFGVDVADLSNEQLDHYCYEPDDSR